MKKQILAVLVMICSYWVCTPATAQVSVHFNIGLQPIWGPVGYDYVDYYYIPDIDAYYDVNSRNYVYYDDGRWITATYLPPRYRNFDLYHAHKVVINEPQPWLHHDRYRGEYAHFKGYHDQHAIRDSREYRYYENPGHPHHSEWHGNEGRGHEGHEEGHGHGAGHGHGEGHGHGHER